MYHNIFVVGHLALTDFGAAAVLPKAGTKVKTVVGTTSYVAPEILLGEAHGGGVDWWSLGMVLYEMLTGGLPFDEGSENLFTTMLDFPVQFPDDIPIPQSVKELITGLLRKNAQARHGKHIMDCEWLCDLNWTNVLQKKYKPSFIPEVKSIDDITYFPIYHESVEHSGPALADTSMFDNF